MRHRLVAMSTRRGVRRRSRPARSSGTVEGRTGRRHPRRDRDAHQRQAAAPASTPAVTNPTGDFVFANVAADTYTVEVTMSGVQDAQAARASSSAPATASPSGSLTHRSRRHDRDRRRQGRGAADPGAERRAIVHGRRPSRSRTCRSRAAASPRSPQLAPGVIGTSRIGDRSSTGGGNSNVMMDGVSTMDTGSNAVARCR